MSAAPYPLLLWSYSRLLAMRIASQLRELRATETETTETSDEDVRMDAWLDGVRVETMLPEGAMTVLPTTASSDDAATTALVAQVDGRFRLLRLLRLLIRRTTTVTNDNDNKTATITAATEEMVQATEALTLAVDAFLGVLPDDWPVHEGPHDILLDLKTHLVMDRASMFPSVAFEAVVDSVFPPVKRTARRKGKAAATSTKDAVSSNAHAAFIADVQQRRRDILAMGSVSAMQDAYNWHHTMVDLCNLVKAIEKSWERVLLEYSIYMEGDNEETTTSNAENHSSAALTDEEPNDTPQEEVWTEDDFSDADPVDLATAMKSRPKSSRRVEVVVDAVAKSKCTTAQQPPPPSPPRATDSEAEFDGAKTPNDVDRTHLSIHGRHISGFTPGGDERTGFLTTTTTAASPSSSSKKRRPVSSVLPRHDEDDTTFIVTTNDDGDGDDDQDAALSSDDDGDDWFARRRENQPPNHDHELNDDGPDGGVVSPKRRRVGWTEYEVALLERGIRRYGRGWTQILSHYGKGQDEGFAECRTSVDLKDKARNEKKRRERLGLDLGVFGFI